MTKRHEFLKPTIEILRARVANRCSNPDCRVPTTGPTEKSNGVNNVGIAAHITAAAPGGPRYDESMTKEERRSIDNAIWLCSNCSIKIDRDEQKYSVPLLLAWKKKAEEKAAEELGKQLPDDDYVVKSLTTAFTGHSPAYLPQILSNASKAINGSLEQLDQRFSIESSYVKGITSYKIRPKEPVKLELSVDKNFEKDFIEQYKNLKEHGDKLSIDTEAIEFKGSPLFKEIFSQEGRLEIGCHSTKNSIQKLWLENPSNSETQSFYDVIGKTICGTHSLTFEGATCDGLITLKFRFHLDQEKNTDSNCSFNLNFQKWHEKDISFLPYLESIDNLFQKIDEGWQLHSSFEIEGMKIGKGTYNFQECDFFQGTQSHLHYIKMVMEISRKLNLRIQYSNSYEYSGEEHMNITKICQMLSDSIRKDRSSIISNARCSLEAMDDLANIHELLKLQDSPTRIRYEQIEPEIITPFFQEIILPRFVHTLTEVTPIIKTDVATIKPGDIVEVEWDPTETCEYIIHVLE